MNKIELRFIVIYLSVFMLSLIATINLDSTKNIQILNQTNQNDFYWIYIFFAVLTGAFVMYLLIKSSFRISRIFIKMVELVIVFISLFILTYSYSLPFTNNLDSTNLAILSGMIGMFLRMIGKFKNEIAALSTAGIAAVISLSLSPFSSLILMLALSLYDYIAVFKTKHMQVLAKELTKQKAAFSIKESEKIMVNGEEKQSFMEIGTGDLLIPAMVVNSFLSVGMLYTLFVMAGTIIGLKLLIYTLKRYKKMLPAIPFLFVGIILSLFVGIILDSLYTYYFL